MGEKRFDEWNKLKKHIHYSNKNLLYHEREIWWLAIGENIGSEVNGKGSEFLRPVLVIRKYGDLFFGVPLSSQTHRGMWYESFEFKNKTQCVLLSQVGKYSANRLRYKMGRISIKEYYRINDAIISLLFKKNNPNHR